MEQSYYRIGEVSRATGLSKDTLHFYDKIGLLCPEHVDPRNGYRYYSLRNLWQLDIIAACRKLNIPLDTVRQILSLQDNAEIVRLLMEYRQEALRRSAYYQQVASDILWYQEEHRRIEAQKDSPRWSARSGGRRSRSSRGVTPSFSSASGRGGPTSLPCWTGWPPTGRRPTPSTPRSWGCSSSLTWTTTPARCGPT